MSVHSVSWHMEKLEMGGNWKQMELVLHKLVNIAFCYYSCGSESCAVTLVLYCVITYSV